MFAKYVRAIVSLALIALLSIMMGIRPSNAQNLVVNGDFSQGNTGFTTTYRFGSLNADNVYVICSDPSLYHPNAVSYGDHTTGNGLMMAVNGNDRIPVSEVWSETVSVQSKTQHKFSAWVSQWTQYFPCGGQLQFAINGTPVGPIFCVPDQAGTWERHEVTWASGNSTSARLSILHYNQVLVGDDFALDDISFVSDDCPAQILNVLLPETSGNTTWFGYRSDPLEINFTSLDPGSEADVKCKYISNIGTLAVSLDYLGLIFPAQSTTQATVSIFNPAASSIPALQNWDFSQIINNGRLINGPFNPSHAYFRWESPGFEIRPLNSFWSIPPWIFGPLTYWVDLTNLGQMPGTTPVETIIRNTEAYIHVELTHRVVIPFLSLGAAYDVTDALRVRSSGLVYNRGTRTFNGTITITNTSGYTVRGPLQLVLINLTSGVTLANKSGDYRLQPYVSANVSSLAPNGSMQMPVRFNNPNNARIGYAPRIYSGSF